MNKKKRKRLIILALVALTLFILAIGAMALWSIRLTEFTVIGNTIHTDEEIISYVFPETKDTHTIYAMLNKNAEEQKRIPFVKSYELNITGLHSAEIVLYEKGIIGALKYMGSYLYFDSDGYIVDTSTKKLNGVVGIEGFNFDYFVLNDRLPVADDNIFGSILVLSNVIESENLNVDGAYIDTNMNITVYLGDIKAYLGEGTNIEKKLHALQDIYPSIKGMKGTLYLNYSANLLDKKEYFFKEDKGDMPETETETETERIIETDPVTGLELPTEPMEETTEETTEAPTEIPTLEIPIVVVDEKTGEISIIWTQEVTTADETDDETSEGETTEETVENPAPVEPQPVDPAPVEPQPELPIEQAPVEQVPVEQPIG